MTRTPTTSWRHKRLIDGPLEQVQSALKCVRRKANTFGPLGGIQRLAGISEQPVVALVVRLLFHGCPAAISGAVRAIDVDALNRMSRRRLAAHVGQEGSVVMPARVQGDTAAAVVGKRCARRVSAACLKVGPAAILWTASIAMLGSPLSRLIALRTTANRTGFGAQITCRYPHIAAADTSTIPLAARNLGGRAAQYRERSERLAREIKRFLHIQTIPNTPTFGNIRV